MVEKAVKLIHAFDAIALLTGQTLTIFAYMIAMSASGEFLVPATPPADSTVVRHGSKVSQTLLRFTKTSDPLSRAWLGASAYFYRRHRPILTTLVGIRFTSNIQDSGPSDDWDALNRLHEKGFIDDPVGKAKSVFVTEEGAKRSEELFRQFFGK